MRDYPSLYWVFYPYSGVLLQLRLKFLISSIRNNHCERGPADILVSRLREVEIRSYVARTSSRRDAAASGGSISDGDLDMQMAVGQLEDDIHPGSHTTHDSIMSIRMAD
jgi:hypothetical protein